MAEIYTGLMSNGDALTFSEEPAGEVRWFPRSMMQAHDLTLYQRWTITTYKNGRPSEQRREWRKVETGSLDEIRAASANAQ